VSEKAKLIRGDPPKIALKRRGSPLKREIILESPNLLLFEKNKINIFESQRT
jgi:hypothetical protein